jgi:hypothetical protein
MKCSKHYSWYTPKNTNRSVFIIKSEGEEQGESKFYYPPPPPRIMPFFGKSTCSDFESSDTKSLFGNTFMGRKGF